MKGTGWGALCVALLLMTGCGAMQSSASGGTGTQNTRSYVTWNTGHAKTLVTCIDVSASVPRSLIANAEQVLAGEIRSEPKPGSGRTLAYIRTISDNSVNPSNNLLTVDIPAVPKAIERKVSVFDPHKEQAAQQYRQALRRQQSALQRARSQAQSSATKILHLDPPSEDRGTDLYTCPAVAGRLFTPGGSSWLLVVSDLIPSGAPTNLKFKLPGTHAVIFQYCGQDLTGCQGRVARFTQKLKQAGAASTDVYDITQTGVLQHVLPGF